MPVKYTRSSQSAPKLSELKFILLCKALVANQLPIKTFGFTQSQVQGDDAELKYGACKVTKAELKLKGRKYFMKINYDHTKTKGQPGFIRSLLYNDCNMDNGLMGDT